MGDVTVEERKKLERKARKEAKQLMAILKDAPEREKMALESVVENTAWMKAQLDRARDFIGVSDIISEYDHGGGQTGIRTNPAYTGYEALWKAYVTGLNRILAAVPDGEPAASGQPEEPKNVLELIQARRNGEMGRASGDSA